MYYERSCRNWDAMGSVTDAFMCCFNWTGSVLFFFFL